MGGDGSDASGILRYYKALYEQQMRATAWSHARDH